MTFVTRWHCFGRGVYSVSFRSKLVLSISFASYLPNGVSDGDGVRFRLARRPAITTTTTTTHTHRQQQPPNQKSHAPAHDGWPRATHCKLCRVDMHKDVGMALRHARELPVHTAAGVTAVVTEVVTEVVKRSDSSNVPLSLSLALSLSLSLSWSLSLGLSLFWSLSLGLSCLRIGAACADGQHAVLEQATWGGGEARVPSFACAVQHAMCIL